MTQKHSDKSVKPIESGQSVSNEPVLMSSKDMLIEEESFDLSQDLETRTAVSRSSELNHQISSDPTHVYLRQIGFVALLTAEEEISLARQVQAGNQQAVVHMIEANLRLVVKISRRYCQRGIPFLDLIEEGNLGLMHAVNKYDPNKGFRFSTYATWWIRQYVERSIMNQSRTIRLPVHVIKELNTYLRAGQLLERELEHEPTAEEVSAMLDKPLEDVRRVLDLKQDTLSLDLPLHAEEGNKATIIETVHTDVTEDPCDLVSMLSMSEHIEKVLDQLDSDALNVLKCRFGLRGEDHLTLDQTAARLNLTRGKVRGIQLRALKELKVLCDQAGLSLDQIQDEDQDEDQDEVCI